MSECPTNHTQPNWDDFPDGLPRERYTSDFCPDCGARLADTREGSDNESEGLYLGITPGPEHNTEDEDATKTNYIDEWSEQFGPDTREGPDSE